MFFLLPLQTASEENDLINLLNIYETRFQPRMAPSVEVVVKGFRLVGLAGSMVVDAASNVILFSQVRPSFLFSGLRTHTA